MKKQLLMYTFAGLFLASCSSTIERNATAFGGGWGMSEKKEISQVKEFNDGRIQTTEKDRVEKPTENSIEAQNQNAYVISNKSTTPQALLYKKEILTLNASKKSKVIENGNSVLDESFKEKDLSKKSSKVSKTIANHFKRKIEKIKKSASQVGSSSGGGKGFAITSLVLGILGLFFLGILFGPLAIIFGIIGLNKNGGGMALAGLILGIIDLILWVLLVLLLILSL